MAANYAYQAGSWLTAMHTLRVAMAAYGSYVDDPWNHERHPEVWDMIAHQAIMLHIARDHRPDLAVTIETTLAESGFDDWIRRILDGTDTPERWTEAEVAQIADREGTGRPFSDAGRTRSYTWRALGMTWTVRAANDHDAVLAAERFTAAARPVRHPSLPMSTCRR